MQYKITTTTVTEEQLNAINYDRATYGIPMSELFRRALDIYFERKGYCTIKDGKATYKPFPKESESSTEGE